MCQMSVSFEEIEYCVYVIELLAFCLMYLSSGISICLCCILHNIVFYFFIAPGSLE